MSRSCWALLLVVCAAVVRLYGQPPQAPDQKPLAFEVASIKRGQPGTQRFGVNIRGSEVRAVNMPLRLIVNWAYNIQPVIRHDIVEGGPGWIDTDGFDIVAKALARPSADDARQMMRALLAQRFKMRLHTENRDVPVFALVLAKKDGSFGPGLKRSAHDCAALNEAFQNNKFGVPRSAECGLRRQGDPRLRTVWHGSGGMAVLIYSISRERDIDRRIVDRTGLTGTFDIDLTFDSARPRLEGLNEITPSDDGTSVFTALQEQLGLKLEARHDAVAATVIDHVEKPTPD